MAVKRRNYLGRLVLIISMFLVCFPAFGGTIVINGSFESANYDHWTQKLEWGSSPVVGNLGWIYMLFGVNDLNWPAYSEGYSAYPGPGWACSAYCNDPDNAIWYLTRKFEVLSQDLVTDPGAKYNLTFVLSMFPVTPEAAGIGLSLAPNAFQVKWGNMVLMGWGDPADPNNPGLTTDFRWRSYSFHGLQPTGASTTLSFGFYAPNWSLGLDDVSVSAEPVVEPVVEPIPEPASLLLLGTGLMSAGWFLRRKIASGG